MQDAFNAQMLRVEQQEYAREGIALEYVAYAGSQYADVCWHMLTYADVF